MPDDKATYKTISDINLQLHVFRPKGHVSGDKRPCIVFFSGGGWVTQSPSQFYTHSRYLTSRGMIALCATYRVKDPNGTTPFECVKDGKSAIRWVRTHAAELGVDPDRIAGGGGSAGAHMAAAAANCEAFDEPSEDKAISSRPNALVLFNPVFDNGPSGFGYERVKERWREFSPMHNIDANSPPTIFFFGTQDPLVPVSTIEEYKTRMTKAGVRCDVRLYEGQRHAFFNYRDGRNTYYYQTVIETDKFLASLGWIQGEPTLVDITSDAKPPASPNQPD